MIAHVDPSCVMKDSVPWLVELSGHWDVRQFRRLGTSSKDNGETKEDEVTETYKRLRPRNIADKTTRACQGAVDVSQHQCRMFKRGALQEKGLREEVCRAMEGGREAFARRWARLGREV